jgi:hypothetical protein
MRTLHAGEGDLREDVIDELIYAFRHCRPERSTIAIVVT